MSRTSRNRDGSGGASAPTKVGLVSLGCAKNLVDSEVMLGSLQREGMEIAADAKDADVLIVNTCGFIDAAKQESIDAVLSASGLKDNGRCRALIMAGCLTQRYPKELRDQLPGVDAIVGLNEVPRIGEIVREVLTRNGGVEPNLFWSGPAKYIPDFSAPRVRLTPSHYAYVKIAEGCNHPCTFCSIPRIRGIHRSRQPEDVLAEVRALVKSGVREINLISQDTTFYGRDLCNPETVMLSAAKHLSSSSVPKEILRSAQNDNCSQQPSISSLLRDIQRIEGDFWVRLLYTHPMHWTDELVETIAACDKVCRYVDIPLQHISDDVLGAMRRETDGRHIRDLIGKIRAGIPDVALRTAFIVGFPGETDRQFEELMGFIEDSCFERLGIFKYSQEDHTPAGAMDGQISAKVKNQRYHKAMALQQRVSRTAMGRFVGRTLRVLVEEPVEQLPDQFSGALGKTGRGGEGLWIGRSHADAPEIDGAVYILGPAKAGEFSEVRITDSSKYDLLGHTKHSL